MVEGRIFLKRGGGGGFSEGGGGGRRLPLFLFSFFKVFHFYI